MSCSKFFPDAVLFYALFFSSQERLMHRNGGFHTTEDNRGITQRAKRSPAKQPDTGMSNSFWIYPHVMSLILMLWQRHMLILKLYCWTISIIRAVALNLVHLMNQPEYALWCTCMCVTFMELSQLWGNGSCNCWFKLIYIHIIIHPIMRGFLKTFSKWCFIYCSRLNSSSTTWCCWVYRARDLLEWNWLLLGEQWGLGGFHQFENKQPSLCWFPPS